jgi:fatty acid-binding protein DegV
MDSRNYSISYGYGVIRGVNCYRAGGSEQEVIAAMESWFQQLETYFTIFDLKFVRRSGRISAAAQIIGEARWACVR